MKFAKYFIILGFCVLFLGSLVIVPFYAPRVFESSATTSFSSTIWSIVYKSLLLAAIPSLFLFLATSYLKLRLYFRLLLTILFLTFVTNFLASDNGAFSLKLFPAYPYAEGFYETILITGMVDSAETIYTFETSDKPEKIIEYYQHVLNEKKLRIHGLVYNGAFRPSQNIYADDVNFSNYLKKQLTANKLIILNISCNTNNKSAGALAIDESSNEKTKVKFYGAKKGLILLTPLNFC